MKKHRDTFYLYMVRCSQGTFYTGYTNDLEHRMAMHNTGKGAKYLRGKAPIILVYCKEYHDLGAVMQAECALKRLKRCEKDELVNIFRKMNPALSHFPHDGNEER